MARARLLDVPCDESRQALAGRTLRLDLKPQFRRPPRLQGPHPSGVAGDGGGGGDRRAFRRYPGLAVGFRRSEIGWRAKGLRLDGRRLMARIYKSCGKLQARCGEVKAVAPRDARIAAKKCAGA